MSTTIAPQDAARWRSRLDLPAYRFRDAARYAGVPTRTVTYWHRASAERPATLPGRELRRSLSYYELIEVAFVSTFRRLGISLQKIRAARDYAARELDSEFPFVQYAWKTEGVHLMLQLSDIVGDAEVSELVAADLHGQVAWGGVFTADLHGQVAWGGVFSERFEEFDYQDEIAAVWHVASRGNPVSIDSRVAFGAPSVHGIPTWILKGRWDAGETIGGIRADYGLAPEDIAHGLRFEGVLEDELTTAC